MHTAQTHSHPPATQPANCSRLVDRKPVTKPVQSAAVASDSAYISCGPSDCRCPAERRLAADSRRSQRKISPFSPSLHALTASSRRSHRPCVLTVRSHRSHRLMFFSRHQFSFISLSLRALAVSMCSHHLSELSPSLSPSLRILTTSPCSPSQFSPSPRALTVSCVMTVLAGSRETLLGTRSAPSHHCPADMAGSAPAVAGNSSPWKSRYVCRTENEVRGGRRVTDAGSLSR